MEATFIEVCNAVRQLLFGSCVTMFGFTFSLADVFVGLAVIYLIFYSIFKIFN